MTKSSTSIFFLFCLFFSCSTLLGQNNSCNYQLQLIDFFGDGWDGATVTAITEQDTNIYTLPDSTIRFFDLELTQNEPLQLFFNAGPKDEEIRYILFDENGDIIFNDGPSPRTGLIFETFACPTCPSPKNIFINPSDESATIHWSALEENGEYLIAYGLKGFRQDEGSLITTQDTILTLPNLLPFTEYDVYLTTVCANQDTSLTTVSTSFQTKYTNDVGISNVQTPRSDCQLSNAEMLTVTLENYGALPQSLIPFRFSVNGEDGGVMIPNDGFFTNVLGKDSSVTLTFETTYDFTESKLYDVAVWTELVGDELLDNDTAYVQIRSTPTIEQLPYSEDFEEGEAGWFSTNPSIKFEENSTSQNPLENDNQ
ncbi:MAG: fibronectin type III domain-containing protein, partial [Bacteroidota bacterium]